MTVSVRLLQEGRALPLSELSGPDADAESRERWRRLVAQRSAILQRDLRLREQPLQVEDTVEGSIVRVRGIAGTMRLGGRELDIAPKHVDGSAGNWRTAIIAMLERSTPRRAAYSPTVRLDVQRRSFIDQFAYSYALALESAVRREPIRLYRSRREELPVLRGRLRVVEQLRSSLTRPHRLICEVDYLEGDNPTNRLLHWAGRRLVALSTDPRVRQLLSYQLGRLPHVSEPVRLPVPLVAAVPRQYSHYASAVQLAMTYARGQSVQPGVSDVNGAGLVIGTERLFESFIEKTLAAVVPARSPGVWHVRPQASEEFAVPLDSGRRYFSRPDNVVDVDGSNVIVIDAKYKRFADATDDATPGHPTNADLYQMCAACVAHSCSRALLVYPRLESVGDIEDAPPEWNIRWWQVDGVGSQPIWVGAATVDLQGLGAPDGLHVFDAKIADLLESAIAS